MKSKFVLLSDLESEEEAEGPSESEFWKGPAPALEEKSRWAYKFCCLTKTHYTISSSDRIHINLIVPLKSSKGFFLRPIHKTIKKTFE